jgi:hypothetical protein
MSLDYADAINASAGLPSPAGKNMFTLHLRMTPGIGP